MATINCPNCNQTYEVDDSVIGQKVECAVCSSTFVARQIKTAKAVESWVVSQDAYTTSDPIEPLSANPRVSKRFIVLISAAGAGLVLLSITAVLFLANALTGVSLPPGSPSELLLKYAEMGETPYVTEVLKQNRSFEVDRPRADGNKTALYLACEKGYEDIVNLLLKRKANATICDSETDKKYSPLTIAARNGHLTIVKTLLKAGIGIESRDGENRTALYAAAANNKLEVVEYLCLSKAEINSYGRNGWTPLTVATVEGHNEIIKALLKYDADLEKVKKDEKGDFTAVFQASAGNHPDIVEYLCKSGAKVNVYGINGWTPLTAAASEGYTEVVNILLKFGKGIDLEMVAKSKEGDSTALYHATVGNHPDIVEILCKAGAKVNVYGINGWTPLTAAAKNGFTEVVNVLQKYSADLEMRNQPPGGGGNTPLHHAVDNNHLETVEVLCKAGASQSSYSSYVGYTPLTCAVDRGKIEIIKILLKYGADPHQKDKSGVYGKNAFETAQTNGRQDIVDLLKNPPRLETKETAKASNTQNLKSAHEFVMKSINEIQRGNYAGGTDMDLYISKLRTAKSNFQQKLVNVPDDYRNAVLDMVDTHLETLLFAKNASPSLGYSNSDMAKRQEMALKTVTDIVDSYKALNKVLRKYGLKEIDDASGRFE